MMPNNELVSRSAAKQAVHDTVVSGSTVVRIWDAIDKLPTVDTAPVVHARWQTTEAYPHRLYCLNCYHTFVPNVEWVERCNIPTNFCPHCGAKMDGGENDAPD